MLLVEADRARDRPAPLARVVATAVAGVDPAVMGLGPDPGHAQGTRARRVDVDDLDLIELNEAFASQSIV